MIVILGHTGFIGRSLFRYFNQQGQETRGVSSVQCDLTDAAAVQQCLGSIDRDFALINCAVLNSTQCRDYAALQVNAVMMENILGALSQGRCRAMIHLSSVDVYGIHPPLPIVETTAVNPVSYYGLAKYIGEKLIAFHAKRSFPAMILRLPGIYGPGDGEGSLIGNFIGKILRGEKLILYNMGQVLRDYCAVQDLVAVIDALLAKPQELLLNVATGTSRSLSEIVELIGEAIQRRPNLVLQQEDAEIEGTGDLVFDITRLRRLLPQHHWRSMQQGIADYLTAMPPDSKSDLKNV